MTEREKQVEALVDRLQFLCAGPGPPSGFGFETWSDKARTILTDELAKAEERGRALSFYDLPERDRIAMRQGWLEAAEWYAHSRDNEMGTVPHYNYEGARIRAEAERRYPEGDDARA